MNWWEALINLYGMMFFAMAAAIPLLCTIVVVAVLIKTFNLFKPKNRSKK